MGMEALMGGFRGDTADSTVVDKMTAGRWLAGISEVKM